MTLTVAPPPAVFPNLTNEARAMALSRIYAPLSAEEMLREALLGALSGRIALVSSFGAESVVLLHMLAEIDRTTPVIFLETQMLFPETLAYQRQVATYLSLKDLRIVRPDPVARAAEDPAGDLHQTDTNACCALRKTRPLSRALAGFDGWITGRKRYQAASRTEMPLFENDTAGRLKLNPLAAWGPQAASDYIRRHRLPPHPLVADGYPSIGCAPCTSKVADGEDPRAGRWRGSDKTECGIHFEGGKMVQRSA